MKIHLKYAKLLHQHVIISHHSNQRTVKSKTTIATMCKFKNTFEIFGGDSYNQKDLELLLQTRKDYTKEERYFTWPPRDLN